MTTCSTHVLDAALGLPARALSVALQDPGGRLMASAATDDDGRLRFDLMLDVGTHRLVFGTGAYYAVSGRETFYPEVGVSFAVDPTQPHYHVALLLSPFAYTTYRGS